MTHLDQTETVESTPPPIIRALSLGSIGVLAIGVAPLCLESLIELGRITPPMLGVSITAELLGIAIGAVLGRWLLGTASTAWGARGMLLMLVAANLACAFVDGYTVAIMRGLAGFAGGTLVWCAVAAILRTDQPERLSGIFITAQTMAQFALAIALTTFLIARFGANAGYISLAIIPLLGLSLTVGLPNLRPMATEKPNDEQAPIPAAAWIGLASITAFMATLNAIISYAVPVFTSADVSLSSALNVFQLVLASQIIAGILGSALSERLASTFAISAVYVGLAIVIIGVSFATDATLLFAIFALYGFCWLFVAPFHVGFLLKLDPTRRAAETSPAFQLSGLALGPLLASSQLMENGAVSPTLFSALLGTSFILFFAALMLHTKSVKATAG